MHSRLSLGCPSGRQGSRSGLCCSRCLLSPDAPCGGGWWGCGAPEPHTGPAKGPLNLPHLPCVWPRGLSLPVCVMRLLPHSLAGALTVLPRGSGPSPRLWSPAQVWLRLQKGDLES